MAGEELHIGCVHFQEVGAALGFRGQGYDTVWDAGHPRSGRDVGRPTPGRKTGTSLYSSSLGLGEQEMHLRATG